MPFPLEEKRLVYASLQRRTQTGSEPSQLRWLVDQTSREEAGGLGLIGPEGVWPPEVGGEGGLVVGDRAAIRLAKDFAAYT